MFLEKYRSEVDKILARYPADRKRSAVMPLLFLAHREYGYVPQNAMDDIAATLDISATQVASIVGFYTLYYDEKQGEYRIQICTDLPCALRGADEFARQVYEDLRLHPGPHGATTEDGMFTVEEVMCLAACDKAPMFQLQGRDGISYHEHQTREDVAKLVTELRNGKKEGSDG